MASTTRPPSVGRRIVLEAAVYLILARLATRLLPFRYLAQFSARPLPRTEVVGNERVRLREEVCWAIYQVNQHLPGESTCLPQALATQALLRRKRIGTVLYYGVARQPGLGLAGHVWVQDGAEGIMGHLINKGYAVLARYPDIG